jgi:hypothetical protein
MKHAHDGMTMDQRRFLQFWIEANGWEHWYVELNGELPMPAYRWEDELGGQDRDGRLDAMRSVDELFDPPPEE